MINYAKSTLSKFSLENVKWNSDGGRFLVGPSLIGYQITCEQPSKCGPETIDYFFPGSLLVNSCVLFLIITDASFYVF